MTRCAPPTRDYRYGLVEEEAPLYYAPEHSDGCPFPHRRKVKWSEHSIAKARFSIPAQKNLSAAKTLFEFRFADEFQAAIGTPTDSVGPRDSRDTDTKSTSRGARRSTGSHERQVKEVLDQILARITPGEFEDLTKALMEAMGFEEVDRVGRSGDQGVDVKGTLQSSLVNIDVYVQAKHYSGKRVPASDVKKLHGAIPHGGQGAIITTTDFQKQALAAAEDSRFAPVTLVNGRQLVELLMEHWNADSLALSPDEDVPSWHDRLGLTQGLVPK